MADAGYRSRMHWMDNEEGIILSAKEMQEGIRDEKPERVRSVGASCS